MLLCGCAENKFGYSSRMEFDYFGDLKDSFTKEKTNTSAEKNEQACLDCLFYSFRRKRRSSIEGSSIEGEDNINNINNINKLPDEIILMILKWLPTACLIRSMLVCKRWYQIGQDERLWTTARLRYKVLMKLNKGALGYILPRGVEFLLLQRTKIVDPVFCKGSEVFSNSYISKLQYLSLAYVVISPIGLAALLSKCKYLKGLLLQNCIINRDYCRAISQNTELEVLNLFMCLIDEGCIKHLEKLSIKLKCLIAINVCVEKKCNKFMGQMYDPDWWDSSNFIFMMKMDGNENIL